MIIRGQVGSQAETAKSSMKRYVLFVYIFVFRYSVYYTQAKRKYLQVKDFFSSLHKILLASVAITHASTKKQHVQGNMAMNGSQPKPSPPLSGTEGSLQPFLQVLYWHDPQHCPIRVRSDTRGHSSVTQLDPSIAGFSWSDPSGNWVIRG